MTHTITGHTAGTAARVAVAACTVGGVLFIIDTVTITVINSNFGTADDALFFAGLTAFAVALGALALHLSSPSRGARRMVRTVATFLALVIGLGAFSLLMDAFGRRVFSDTNIGLHGEWSFFSVGVVLLAVAGWMHWKSPDGSRGGVASPR